MTKSTQPSSLPTPQQRATEITWHTDSGIAIARVGNKPVGHVIDLPAVTVTVIHGEDTSTRPSRRHRRQRVWSAKLYEPFPDQARCETQDEAKAAVERFYVNQQEAIAAEKAPAAA